MQRRHTSSIEGSRNRLAKNKSRTDREQAEGQGQGRLTWPIRRMLPLACLRSFWTFSG